MTDRELMQMAFDALELCDPVRVEKEVEALRARLAQPEPEPKCGAIIEVFGKDWRLDYMSLPVGKHKLYTQQYTYTAPPQREWQGLTDEEVRDFWSWSMTQDAEHTANTQQHAFARAIEAKLKEKNT